MPTTPMAPRPVRIGRNKPLCAGQRVGTASGGSIVLPRPLRRCDIGLVEHVLRRVADLDGDRSVLRQQDDHAHVQHQCGLVGRRPQHVVEGTDAGELAAEGIKRLQRAYAPMCDDGLRASARGKMRHDNGDYRKEQERRDIDRVGNRERVDRRQEEEVVTQRGCDAGHQRWPETEPYRDCDHRRKEHQVDVLDTEQRLDQLRRLPSAMATASSASP